MAYQVRRQQVISEDLELVGKDGEVQTCIHVEIHPENIAKAYNAAKNRIIKAQLAVKKGAAEDVFEAFGTAVLNMFEVVFGEENTKAIVDFYEDNYVEMAQEMMPFITDVVAPAIEAAVNDRKKQLANNYHLSREQRRRLGI